MISSRLISALLIVCLRSTEAVGQRNVTIDDEFGDEITQVVPSFMPLGGWTLRGGAKGFAKPDPSLTYNRTWHDATQHAGEIPKTVNFNFTGPSLYVYCIIANTPPGRSFDTSAHYNFFLDGKFVGTYIHDPQAIPDYFYDSLVYVNTTMENEHHSFSIILDAREKPVLMLFDYAVYTTIEQRSPTPSLSPTDSSEASDRPIIPSNAGVVRSNTLGVVALGFPMIAMLLPVVYL